MEVPNKGEVLESPTAKRSAADDGVLESGTVIGEFSVEERIGTGAGSIVYRARHVGSERKVALKVLKQANDETGFQRFFREVKAITSLNHRNIVRIYSIGQLEDARPYMVMEYVAGKDLREVFKRDELRPELLTIFKQICGAMGAAHNAGIIHRDLKPSNVMFVHNDFTRARVKLVDFGLAGGSFKSDDQTLTRPGELIGTPLYMSPEQCLGEEIDSRSDIYSLGCLMFEGACGRPPFDGISAMEVMSKHIRDQPQIDTSLPADWQKVIMKALHKDRAQRYQSMGELDDALSRLKALPTRMPRRKAFRRDNFYVWATAFLLVAGIAGGAYFHFRRLFYIDESDREAAAAFLRQGNYAYNAGRSQEAFNLAEQAIQYNPKDPDAYALRFRSGGGTDDIEKALELRPNHPEYLFLRAQDKELGGKIDDALADLKLIEDQKRSKELDVYFYILKARILSEQKKYDDVIDAANAGLKLRPGARELVRYRGRALLALGKHEAALEEFRTSLKSSEAALRKHNSIASKQEIVAMHRCIADVYDALGKEKDAQNERELAKELELKFFGAKPKRIQM